MKVCNSWTDPYLFNYETNGPQFTFFSLCPGLPPNTHHPTQTTKSCILVLTFSLFVGGSRRGQGRRAGLLDGQPQLCVERLQFCVEYLNCRAQLGTEGVQSETEPSVGPPHHVVAARLLRPNSAVVLTLTHRQAAQCHFSSHCKSTANCNLSL